MTLLRAAEAVPEPAPRQALSTLASLATPSAPPPPAVPPAAASPHAFPLINALDLPLGVPLRRMAPPEPVVEEPRVEGPPAEPVAGEAPSPPTVLSAAEVEAPLAELFRLLAAGPAAPDEAFAALRFPQAPADA